MMRRKISRDHESGEATINLTPLIDVVFVVLIMFILVAPMLELDRIDLATTSQKEQKKEMALAQEKSPLIHVREDNTILFNGKQVKLEQLLSLLKEERRHHPHGIPQLFHDKKAYFGTYQSVKNAVESSGFEQMDVILKPG